MFDIYIGIDYSGAGRPDEAIEGLAVVKAVGEDKPSLLHHPRNPRGWTRSDLHAFLASELEQRDARILVGIDHGFSYPLSELEHYGLSSWDAFLVWIENGWDTRNRSVSECKKHGVPYRNSKDLRLAEERYAIGASSVLDLDRIYGHPSRTVSYSSHAGIPWLASLRRASSRQAVQFWPYDHIAAGEDGALIVNPPSGHVLAEVYPKICKERLNYKAYPPEIRCGQAMTGHQIDAYAIVEWAQERDRAGALMPYFQLETLTPHERKTAALEGWILGCL